MANPAEDAQQVSTPRRSRQSSGKLRASTNSKRNTRTTSPKPVRKSSSSNNIADLEDAVSSRSVPRTPKRVSSLAALDMKRQSSAGSLKKVSSGTSIGAKREGSKNQLNATWHNGTNPQTPRVKRRESRVSNSLTSSAHTPTSKARDSRHSRRSTRGPRTPVRTQSDRLSRPSSSQAKSLPEENDDSDVSEPDYALETENKTRASQHSRRSTRGPRTPVRSQSDRLSRPSSSKAKKLLGDNDEDNSEIDEDALKADTRTKAKQRRGRDKDEGNSESEEEAVEADTKTKVKRRGSKLGNLLGGLASSLGNSSSNLSLAGLSLVTDTTEKRRRRTPSRSQSETLKRPTAKEEDDDHGEGEEASNHNNAQKERQRRTRRRDIARSSSGGDLQKDSDKPQPRKRSNSEGTPRLDADESEEGSNNKEPEKPELKRRSSKFGLSGLGRSRSDKGLPSDKPESTKSDMSDTSGTHSSGGKDKLKKQSSSSKISTTFFQDAGNAVEKLTAGTVMGGAGKATGAVLGGAGKATDFVLGGAVNATGAVLGGAGKATGAVLGGAGKATGAVLGGTATAAGAVLGVAGNATGAVLGVAGDATEALFGGAMAGMFGMGTTKQKEDVMVEKDDSEYEYITEDENALCLMMTIHEGEGLVAKDKNKYGRKVSSDPYAVAEIWPKGLPPDETKYDMSMYPKITLGKTRTVIKNLSPVWETTLDPFNIKTEDLAEESLVRICLWDDDFGDGEDDPMGHIDIFLQPSKAMERDRRWYQVSKTSATRASGRVQVSLVTLHAKQKKIVGKRKKKPIAKMKDESVMSDGSDTEVDDLVDKQFEFMEANSAGIGNALMAANFSKVRRNNGKNGRVRKSMVSIKLGAKSTQRLSTLHKGQDDQPDERPGSSTAKGHKTRQVEEKESTMRRSRSSAGLEGKDLRSSRNSRFRSHSAHGLRKASVVGTAGSTPQREQNRSTSRSRRAASSFAKEKEDDNATALSSTSSHKTRGKREGSRSDRPSSSSRKQSKDAEPSPARKISSKGASQSGKGERKSGKQSSGSREQSQSRTSASKKEESRSRSCSTKQKSKRSS